MIGTRVVSCVWSLATHVGRSAYQRGWISAKKLDCRVVSVGNIQAGGAGKTPMVRQIAQEAIRQGKVVVILSRGYRGQWENKGGILGPGLPDFRAEIVGDEPALLRDLLPEAWIGVGADRSAQYTKIKEKIGRAPDLVILDDGFQHFRIHKDVEIVAVTSATPREIVFRDSRQALRGADLVVWTKGEIRPETGGRPLVRVSYRIPSPRVDGPFHLVTGVADGGLVRDATERAGYKVIKHHEFTDHASYSRSQIQGILEEAQKAGCRILVTGKDWAKWRGQLAELRESSQTIPEVIPLEPELEFHEGRENWDRILWGR